jgi:acetylornithine deacetylase
MRVAIGHKGKTAARVMSKGRTGHSALAPNALNAIHMACDMISLLRDMQAKIEANGARDDAYDVPFTTLHVGRIAGGTALNIVPETATFEFEIRNLAEDDPAAILKRIREHRDLYLADLHKRFPEADISIDITNSYPPLGTAKDSEVTQLVQSLTRPSATIKVAFGTEGGLFASHLNVPTVVCGPGSMEQGHKPDEFIALSQLADCDAMLDTLLSRLVDGI